MTANSWNGKRSPHIQRVSLRNKRSTSAKTCLCDRPRFGMKNHGLTQRIYFHCSLRTRIMQVVEIQSAEQLQLVYVDFRILNYEYPISLLYLIDQTTVPSIVFFFQFRRLATDNFVAWFCEQTDDDKMSRQFGFGYCIHSSIYSWQK